MSPSCPSPALLVLHLPTSKYIRLEALVMSLYVIMVCPKHQLHSQGISSLPDLRRRNRPNALGTRLCWVSEADLKGRLVSTMELESLNLIV